MSQERNLSNSLPALRVFYMVLSEFQNIICKHVSKYYVEIAEGSSEPHPHYYYYYYFSFYICS